MLQDYSKIKLLNEDRFFFVKIAGPHAHTQWLMKQIKIKIKKPCLIFSSISSQKTGPFYKLTGQMGGGGVKVPQNHLSVETSFKNVGNKTLCFQQPEY